MKYSHTMFIPVKGTEIHEVRYIVTEEGGKITNLDLDLDMKTMDLLTQDIAYHVQEQALREIPHIKNRTLPPSSLIEIIET